MALDERHDLELAAAFARGRLGLARSTSDADALAQGEVAGLKLHKFKRTDALPRVQRVLSLLRGLAPSTALDVGSGRGVFLWPLLRAFPSLDVFSCDADALRAQDLGCVSRGGVERLRALRADVTRLPLRDGAVEVVTALEVLEHLHDAREAVRELLRVASRTVIVSVPAHEDDNPDHHHLFDLDELEALFRAAGARRTQRDGARGHLVLLAHR